MGRYRLTFALFLRGIIAVLCLYVSETIATPDYARVVFHPVPLNESPAEYRTPDPAQTFNSDPAAEVPAIMATRSSSSAGRDVDSGNGNLRQTPDRLTLALRKFSDPSPESTIRQYEENIARLEDEGGPFNPLIGEQALALGDLLQQAGEHLEAIDAYEKSLHTLRVNHGLYTLEQDNILRKMIKSRIALGDFQGATENQQALFYLQQKNFAAGDPDMIPALLEWADWNVNLYLLEQSTLPVLSNSVSESGNSPGATINARLNAAQDLYLKAIELIRRSTEPADPRLAHTERKLAALSYIINKKTVDHLASIPGTTTGSLEYNANRRKLEQANSAHFFYGSNALKRAIAYSLNTPQPEYVSIARHMMELGDWYLLFDRRTAALGIYEQAFEVLAATHATEEEINRVMSPGMPVPSPETVIQLNNPLFENEYQGYIDVQFSLSKYGIASNPEVIGTSDEDVSQLRKALIRNIRKEKFRPAFIDGSASSKENVKLRYYYSYN